MPNQKEAHQGPLGLSNEARDRLQTLSGATPMAFYAACSVEGKWRTTSNPASLHAREVMYIGSTWTAEIEGNDRSTFLHLADGVWLDLDDKHNVQHAIVDCCETATRLQTLGILLDQCSLFASGGKGFHIFVPLALMVSGRRRSAIRAAAARPGYSSWSTGPITAVGLRKAALNATAHGATRQAVRLAVAYAKAVLDALGDAAAK